MSFRSRFEDKLLRGDHRKASEKKIPGHGGSGIFFFGAFRGSPSNANFAGGCRFVRANFPITKYNLRTGFFRILLYVAGSSVQIFRIRNITCERIFFEFCYGLPVRPCKFFDC